MKRLRHDRDFTATADSEQTKLDALVNRGIEILRELRRGERPRLSAKAFVKAALKIADCTPADLTAFEAKLAITPGCDDTRRFIRQMVLRFKDTRGFPTPHPDTGRMLNAYGTEGVVGELAVLAATPAMCQALAAREAADRFPENFGVVQDWDSHQRRDGELRKRLAEIHEEMRGAATTADFKSDLDGLLQSEKTRGLTRLVFRRAPGLAVSGDLQTGEWPRKLVEDCEQSIPAAPAKSPKRRKRRRLSEAAVAA